MSKSIRNILEELSIRSGVISTEIDDFSNPMHVLKLREILNEYNIPLDVIDENISYLTEETPDRVKKQAKKMGLVWKRVGYGKEGVEGITHKVEDDKLVPVGNDEKSSNKTGGTGETPPSKPKVTKIETNPFTADGEQNEKSAEEEEKLTPEQMSPEDLEAADHKTTDEQLTLSVEDAKAQAEKKGEKGVGAGTAESRAGEAAVHWAVRELINGKNIDDIRKNLMGLAKDKDKVLDDKWAKAAINTATWIGEVYGDDIDKVVWDTPEGRALIGTEGHGTSSDMFVKLKNGDRVGISLKQSTNVFLLNGGYDKQHGILLDSLADELDPEELDAFESATKIDNYNTGLNRQLTAINTEFKSNGLQELIKERVEHWQKNPEAAAAKGAFDSSKYLKYVDWKTTKSIIEKLPNVKKVEIKYIAKLCKDPEIRKQFPELYDKLRNEDTELTKNILNQAASSQNVSNALKGICTKGMHIEDILFGTSEKLEEFITLYGNNPAVELDKGVILSVFGMQEEYEQFLSASDEAYDTVDGTVPPTDKEAAKEEFMSKLRDKLILDQSDDAKSGTIKIKHSGPPAQVFSLFNIRARSKPIGSSPGLEMNQTSFMGNVIKEGSADIETWKESTKKRFVNTRIKEIMEEYEDSSTEQKEALNQEIDELKKLL